MKKKNLSYFAAKRQNGMSLLEVIVSFLVVGLGLGLLVSMLGASNRYGATAEYRANAMREIQTIVDAMRANRMGLAGYQFGSGQWEDNNYSLSVAKKNPEVKCASAECTLEEKLKQRAESQALTRAQREMTTWLRNVNNSVPAGQGSILRQPDGSYIVRVRWQIGEENQRQDDETKNELIELRVVI